MGLHMKRPLTGRYTRRSHCGCGGGKASGVFWRQLEFGSFVHLLVLRLLATGRRWQHSQEAAEV